MHISRFGKFVVVVAVLWCVGSVVCYSRRTNLSMLLILPLALSFLIAVVISIVCIFSEWRQRRWFALFSFSACVVSVIASRMLVPPIRHAIFVHSLPGYEAVVQQIVSGRIVVSDKLDPIPQAVPLAPFAYAVFAQKDTNGVLTVEFLTERGFPVKHSGYLYCSAGAIAPGSDAASRWPIRHEEKPRWFYVSH